MLRISFESAWQGLRDTERRRGMDNVKQIARLPSVIIPNVHTVDLRLVLNFTD